MNATASRSIAPGPPAPGPPRLEDVYRDEVAFVWRTVRYLGVAPSDAEDVVHDVFMTVQRRIAEFDPHYSMRSWLAGITRNVVMHHHRSAGRAQRRLGVVRPTEDIETELEPEALVSQREAALVLDRFLQSLDPAKREVFVLVELEGLSAPEIARVVGATTNTVYSRLRAARLAFERVVARLERVRRRESG